MSQLLREQIQCGKFLNEVDASSVYWNASTRYTDGFEFGLGLKSGFLPTDCMREGQWDWKNFALTSIKSLVQARK